MSWQSQTIADDNSCSFMINQVWNTMKIVLFLLLSAYIVGTQAIYIKDGAKGTYNLFEDFKKLEGEDSEDSFSHSYEDSSLKNLPSEGFLMRAKRQAANGAMNLALSHQDRQGRDRPVGQVHGRLDFNAVGNNANNYHSSAGVGAGTVVWRSNDKRHSLGIGAYAQQHRGAYQGYNYRSRPDFGAGVGYRFRF